MKVLVTGGAGFIGSHIVEELIRKGHKVVAVDNLSAGKIEFVDKKAVFYKADIVLEKEKIEEIFKKEKPEAVIHTAAQVMLRKSIEEPVNDAMINIIGTINLLETCKNHKVKKIIYTSTGGARYGQPKTLPVNESAELNPESPYGISKHTAEHYIQAYSKLYGIDYLIFCFGNVYGPRDDPRYGRIISVFGTKMLDNENPKIFGDGNQTRDFVYVKDLAEFITDSINKNPKHKLFNIANGKQISVNRIVDELKHIIGSKEKIGHIEAVKGEIRDICLDTKLAEKELGWKPKTSLRKGLEESVKYFKEKAKKNKK